MLCRTGRNHNLSVRQGGNGHISVVLLQTENRWGPIGKAAPEEEIFMSWEPEQPDRQVEIQKTIDPHPTVAGRQ